MDEQTIKQPESETELALNEQLYLRTLAYRSGTITFMELLDAFEQVLGIGSEEAEGVDGDRT